jgi:hypothetical protein
VCGTGTATGSFNVYGEDHSDVTKQAYFTGPFTANFNGGVAVIQVAPGNGANGGAEAEGPTNPGAPTYPASAISVAVLSPTGAPNGNNCTPGFRVVGGAVILENNPH